MNEAIKKILCQHPLFKELLDHSSQSFPDHFKLIKSRRFKKNEVIYKPGIEAKYAYLIADGAIKFEFISSAGQEVFVDIVGPGFVVGELELLSGFEYQCTAVAYEETLLILIPKETLYTLITQVPSFALKFTQQLATNFYFFQVLTTEREASNLKSKLANLLMSLGLRFGKRNDDAISIKISHGKLSEMLNTSRQRVNMQLNDWQKSGLLKCRYGYITIINIQHFSEQSGLANSVISEDDVHPYQS